MERQQERKRKRQERDRLPCLLRAG